MNNFENILIISSIILTAVGMYLVGLKDGKKKIIV